MKELLKAINFDYEILENILSQSQSTIDFELITTQLYQINPLLERFEMHCTSNCICLIDSVSYESEKDIRIKQIEFARDEKNKNFYLETFSIGNKNFKILFELRPNPQVREENFLAFGMPVLSNGYLNNYYTFKMSTYDDSVLCKQVHKKSDILIAEILSTFKKKSEFKEFLIKYLTNDFSIEEKEILLLKYDIVFTEKVDVKQQLKSDPKQFD